MRKRVFIIHGWGGSPEGACLPWLKDELIKLGYEVFAPQLPNTETPIIKEWVNYLSQLVGLPDENTYFVGHSIGCQTIMRYLQTIEQPIGGAIFIAGWFTLNNLDAEEEEIAKPWIDNPIDSEKLKQLTKNYSLIISDNDPFEGFEENIENFEKIDAKINVMPGAGHIEDIELPIALDELLRISK